MSEPCTAEDLEKLMGDAQISELSQKQLGKLKSHACVGMGEKITEEQLKKREGSESSAGGKRRSGRNGKPLKSSNKSNIKRSRPNKRARATVAPMFVPRPTFRPFTGKTFEIGCFVARVADLPAKRHDILRLQTDQALEIWEAVHLQRDKREGEQYYNTTKVIPFHPDRWFDYYKLSVDPGKCRDAEGPDDCRVSDWVTVTEWPDEQQIQEALELQEESSAKSLEAAELDPIPLHLNDNNLRQNRELSPTSSNNSLKLALSPSELSAEELEFLEMDKAKGTKGYDSGETATSSKKTPRKTESNSSEKKSGSKDNLAEEVTAPRKKRGRAAKQKSEPPTVTLDDDDDEEPKAKRQKRVSTRNSSEPKTNGDIRKHFAKVQPKEKQAEESESVESNALDEIEGIAQSGIPFMDYLNRIARMAVKEHYIVDRKSSSRVEATFPLDQIPNEMQDLQKVAFEIDRTEMELQKAVFTYSSLKVGPEAQDTGSCMLCNESDASLTHLFLDGCVASNERPFMHCLSCASCANTLQRHYEQTHRLLHMSQRLLNNCHRELKILPNQSAGDLMSNSAWFVSYSMELDNKSPEALQEFLNSYKTE